MIRLAALTAGYGDTPVLHDINLHIAQGEFTAILGPNGCGKTTLIRVLSGVLPPKVGTVRIHGQDLYALPARHRARLCATVPQTGSTPFDGTVRQLVLMGRYAHSSGLFGYDAADHAAVEEALSRTDSLHVAERQTDALSGGELQRVLLARALAQETEILLLDEAASHLDVARTMELYGLLRRYNEQGTTILSVVHDLNLAALSCQRLIFLKHGRIVCDGPTRDVFTASNLRDIYETDILVVEHPLARVPQAHLVPRLL